jgi:hypothetical protein
MPITTDLRIAWNLIGGPSTISDSWAILDPDGIIIPNTIFGFDGEYDNSDVLVPGKGYWIRTDSGGGVTIAEPPMVAGTVNLEIDFGVDENGNDCPRHMTSWEIVDGNGNVPYEWNFQYAATYWENHAHTACPGTAEPTHPDSPYCINLPMSGEYTFTIYDAEWADGDGLTGCDPNASYTLSWADSGEIIVTGGDFGYEESTTFTVVGQSCEDLGLVTCSDGSCAATECDCPGASCADCGLITCWDDSCAESDDQCPCAGHPNADFSYPEGIGCSCAGNCNDGYGVPGCHDEFTCECYCDNLCEDYGDCCHDMCDKCPECWGGYCPEYCD